MRFPFRRKKDVSDVPTEIQEYYQTERRERTGIAWLLALGTLIVTIGLATLLFFGGRWIYRTVANRGNDKRNTAQTEQNEEKREDNKGEQTPEQSTPSSGTSSTSTSTPNNPGAPAGAAPAAGSGSQVAGTQSREEPLPNTGPGDVVALFTLTSISAAAAHYAISTRRTE